MILIVGRLVEAVAVMEHVLQIVEIVVRLMHIGHQLLVMALVRVRVFLPVKLRA